VQCRQCQPASDSALTDRTAWSRTGRGSDTFDEYGLAGYALGRWRPARGGASCCRWFSGAGLVPLLQRQRWMSIVRLAAHAPADGASTPRRAVEPLPSPRAYVLQSCSCYQRDGGRSPVRLAPSTCHQPRCWVGYDRRAGPLAQLAEQSTFNPLHYSPGMQQISSRCCLPGGLPTEPSLSFAVRDIGLIPGFCVTHLVRKTMQATAASQGNRG
jgi:hypothetical protein